MPSLRAFQFATRVPWAITEDWLKTILQIAAREVDNPQLKERLRAVEAERGQPLANTHTVTVRDGVAVIPVSGPIFRYANLFADISGATSIELLALDFNRALNDATVSAILLNIDSPGGETNGINEFADLVYANRDTKPIIAYAGNLAASAAYWIASAAREVVIDPTALLGSIGVIASVPDPNATTAEEIEFVSSQSPNKRPDPTTEGGKAEIQGVVDALASVFVSTVARNRGVSADTVLSDFGQGGILVGQAAVTAGLADRIGSFEQVLAELATARRPAPSVQARLRTAQTEAHQAARVVVDALKRADTIAATAALPTSARADIDSRRKEGGAIRPPAASASGGARSSATATKETRMSDELEPQAEAPPATAPLILPEAEQQVIDQALAGMSDQFSERQLEMLKSSFETLKRDADAQAAQMFLRWQQEQTVRQAIENYAQHATTPTLDRPYALPVEPGALSSLLLLLNTDQRKAAQGIFDRILNAGLVSFEELGSEGAEDKRNAIELYKAAVTAKMAANMKRVDAIDAVMREQPDLVAQYNEAMAAQAPARKRGR